MSLSVVRRKATVIVAGYDYHMVTDSMKYICTKSNLYPSNSLAVAVSDSDLYRLLTYQVPKLMPLFHSLGPTIVSVQVRGTCVCFVTMPVFFRWGVFSTSPNPQAKEPPLVVIPWLLIQWIRNYPPYWRPVLHPQRATPWWQGPSYHGIAWLSVWILMYTYWLHSCVWIRSPLEGES